MQTKMNQKGQFFSQDVLVAVIIFVFTSLLFIVASQAVFTQVTLINIRNQYDESAHITLTTLVEHPGEPVGWEYMNLDDVNSFGLAKTNNVLEKGKLEKLMYYLDNNYVEAKINLGVSGFDMNLVLVDLEGNVVASAGNESENSFTRLVYERTVYYEGETMVLKGVFSSG